MASPREEVSKTVSPPAPPRLPGHSACSFDHCSFLARLSLNVHTLSEKGTLRFPQPPGKPWGVVVAIDGTVFVTDNDNHQIHVFNAERKFVKSIVGDGNGQLQSPKGIAITTEHLLYIACSKGVDVLKRNGSFVRRISAEKLADPYDVTVYKGEVFVVDRGNSHIAVFDLDGKLQRIIGSEGSAPEQFNQPQGIAISRPDGKMHIYDYKNDCVKVLTTRGDYISEFGNREVRNAHQIWLSHTKHVLVADQDKGVAVFDPESNLIASLPCGGYPHGLAADRKGDLLVACSTDKCVRIF